MSVGLASVSSDQAPSLPGKQCPRLAGLPTGTQPSGDAGYCRTEVGATPTPNNVHSLLIRSVRSYRNDNVLCDQHKSEQIWCCWTLGLHKVKSCTGNICVNVQQANESRSVHDRQQCNCQPMLWLDVVTGKCYVKCSYQSLRLTLAVPQTR